MTSTNTRGLFFLFAAFHAVWALLVYNFPESIAHWLSHGRFSQFASANGYALVVAVLSLCGITAALFPQTVKRFLWIPLLLKGYEMFFAWVFIAGMELNPRMIFHLTMNGILWLAIWILGWIRVVKDSA